VSVLDPIAVRLDIARCAADDAMAAPAYVSNRARASEAYAQGVAAHHANASHSLPDLPADSFFEFYGVRVSPIGDDGDEICLGHPHPLRAIAALNKLARENGFVNAADDHSANVADILVNMTWTWAVLVTECDQPHEEDLKEYPCWMCRTLEESPWWIRWDVTAGTTGAFPVVVRQA